MIPTPPRTEAAWLERLLQAPLAEQVLRDRRGFDDPPGGALVPAIVRPRPPRSPNAMALSVPS